MQQAPPPLSKHDSFKTILLVEDHASYREVVRTAFGSFLPQFRMEEADSIRAALDVMQSRRPDVLVADMTLPDGTALDLASQAGSFIQQGGRMIVISSHAREEMLPVLRRDDIHGYVAKEEGVGALARMILEVSRNP